MHDIGMNTSQLSTSVKHIDETIGLARSWSHDLFHATDAHDMPQISAKLHRAMEALDAARAALADYEQSIEADHNSVGSVKLV